MSLPKGVRFGSPTLNTKLHHQSSLHGSASPSRLSQTSKSQANLIKPKLLERKPYLDSRYLLQTSPLRLMKEIEGKVQELD